MEAKYFKDKYGDKAIQVVEDIIRELAEVEENYELQTYGNSSLSNTVIKYYNRIKEEIEQD